MYMYVDDHISLPLPSILSLWIATCTSLAVTEAGKKGDSYAQTFFLQEYTLNHLIGELNSKPLTFCVTRYGGLNDFFFLYI